jgi:hypothetical protein
LKVEGLRHVQKFFPGRLCMRRTLHAPMPDALLEVRKRLLNAAGRAPFKTVA